MRSPAAARAVRSVVGRFELLQTQEDTGLPFYSTRIKRNFRLLLVCWPYRGTSVGTSCSSPLYEFHGCFTEGVLPRGSSTGAFHLRFSPRLGGLLGGTSCGRLHHNKPCLANNPSYNWSCLAHEVANGCLARLSEPGIRLSLVSTRTNVSLQVSKVRLCVSSRMEIHTMSAFP